MTYEGVDIWNSVMKLYLHEATSVSVYPRKGSQRVWETICIKETVKVGQGSKDTNCNPLA